MTSNQVANASVMVSKQQADESERHNRAYEEETNRHNLVMEQIQSFANDLENKKINNENWYRERSLEIQKDYNDTYLRLQRTQGDAKIAIEQELAAVKKYEAEVNKMYTQGTLEIQRDANELRDRELAERTRNNLELERLKQADIANTVWANQLRDKSIEYQNSYWNASIALGNLNAVYQREHNLNQYQLGLLNAQYNLTSLQERKYEFDKQETLRKTQEFSNILNPITNLFGKGTQMLPLMFR